MQLEVMLYSHVWLQCLLVSHINDKIISPKTCIGIALVYLVSLMHEQSMKSPTVQDVFWPTPGLACIVIIFSSSTGHPSFPIPTWYTNCLLLL